MDVEMVFGVNDPKVEELESVLLCCLHLTLAHVSAVDCIINLDNVHKCSLGLGDHRVQDCEDYKKGHPADFEKGWGRRGR
jgi:hypothetical protein